MMVLSVQVVTTLPGEFGVQTVCPCSVSALLAMVTEVVHVVLEQAGTVTVSPDDAELIAD